MQQRRPGRGRRTSGRDTAPLGPELKVGLPPLLLLSSSLGRREGFETGDPKNEPSSP
jgi:hypothetical protein